MSSYLQRHMPKFEELAQNIYPKSVYLLQKTLFDKLRAFNIEVIEGDTLFNKLAIFDFESICVKTVNSLTPRLQLVSVNTNPVQCL